MPEISIRAFTPGDRAAVIELLLALQRFERAFAPDHAAPTPEFGAWYVEGLLEHVNEHDGIVLVALHDDAPCGFIAGFDEEDAEARSRHFYIAELSVAEGMRGYGVGTRLIAAIEEIARARGYKAVVIGVLVQNTRVKGLYSRLGYRDYAVRLRKKLSV
jgi:ribosomal protein S18 acetylase RimI-like enzyme